MLFQLLYLGELNSALEWILYKHAILQDTYLHLTIIFMPKLPLII